MKVWNHSLHRLPFPVLVMGIITDRQLRSYGMSTNGYERGHEVGLYGRRYAWIDMRPSSLDIPGTSELGGNAWRRGPMM